MDNQSTQPANPPCGAANSFGKRPWLAPTWWPWPQVEVVFDLQDLANHVAEFTLRRWHRADDYLSSWSTSAAEDMQALQQGMMEKRPSIIAELARRDCMERRRAALYRRLSARICAFLSSDGCTIEGIGPTGARVEVPRTILSQLEIDLKNNVLRTFGGGFKWEAVVVLWRLKPATQPETPRQQRPDRKGDQRKVLAALKELYGDDIPTGKGSDGPESIARMRRRLEREKKLTRTQEVIRRALGRKD